jgi:hypothetical protein
MRLVRLRHLKGRKHLLRLDRKLIWLVRPRQVRVEWALKDSQLENTLTIRAHRTARLRATWLVMVAWVPLVTPLVGQLVTQVLLRRLMQLMPLSALQWMEPPPKVARLVPMQVPHKQMTMGRVLQLKKL